MVYLNLCLTFLQRKRNRGLSRNIDCSNGEDRTNTWFRAVFYVTLVISLPTWSHRDCFYSQVISLFLQKVCKVWFIIASTCDWTHWCNISFMSGNFSFLVEREPEVSTAQFTKHVDVDYIVGNTFQQFLRWFDIRVVRLLRVDANSLCQTSAWALFRRDSLFRQRAAKQVHPTGMCP